MKNPDDHKHFLELDGDNLKADDVVKIAHNPELQVGIKNAAL